MMAAKGEDWSTDGLRQQLKGHYVTLTGWLLYHAEHESGASANDPTDAIGAQNWRATCWEIHPITAIDLQGPGAVKPKKHPTTKAPTQSQPEQDTQGTSGNRFFIIALVLIILLLAVLYARSRH